MPENTGQIQEKGRFKKGKSGNPKGKPKGAKHRASLLAEKLFENDIEMVCNLEGEALSKIIEIQAKSIELYDFEKRLQAIEDGAMRK